MRATRFEFESRFWILSLIFTLGFFLSVVDHRNFAVALLRLFSPSLDLDSTRGVFLLRLVFAAGSGLVFLAALLRTWATAYLRAEIVHDTSQHSEALVADGPFRYVRNPLYLANLPLAAGIGFLASRLGWVVMVGGIWLFTYRLILREEEGLLESQGDSYRAYLRAVPRLWPSFTPRVRSGSGQPRWGQAIAGEIFIWLLGAAELCFAFTLNTKLAGIVVASSFAVYFLAVYFLKKRASSSPS